MKFHDVGVARATHVLAGMVGVVAMLGGMFATTPSAYAEDAADPENVASDLQETQSQTQLRQDQGGNEAGDVPRTDDTSKAHRSASSQVQKGKGQGATGLGSQGAGSSEVPAGRAGATVPLASQQDVGAPWCGGYSGVEAYSNGDQGLQWCLVSPEGTNRHVLHITGVVKEQPAGQRRTNYGYSLLRTWDHTMGSEVTGLEFDTRIHAASVTSNLGGLFENMDKLDHVAGMGNVDMSGVTNMESMFRDASVPSLDLSGWDVSRVWDMSEMFQGASVSSLDLGGWDVSKVWDMSEMFERASAQSLDLHGWNMSWGVNVYSMFSVASVSSLDVHGWNTSGITNMTSMFEGASIPSLDLHGWDVSRVTDMISMFDGASVSSLDLSGWDTSKVMSADWMFEYCSSLRSVTLSGTWKGIRVHSNVPGLWFEVDNTGGKESLKPGQGFSFDSLFPNEHGHSGTPYRPDDAPVTYVRGVLAMVRYVDGNGNGVPGVRSVSSWRVPGESFSVKDLQDPGWTVDGTKNPGLSADGEGGFTATVSLGPHAFDKDRLKNGNPVFNVSVVCKRVHAKPVSVVYRDRHGKKLTDVRDHHTQIGPKDTELPGFGRDPYLVSAESPVGWKVVDAKLGDASSQTWDSASGTVSGTYCDKAQSVTFVCERVKSNLTVNYAYRAGDGNLQPVPSGDANTAAIALSARHAYGATVNVAAPSPDWMVDVDATKDVNDGSALDGVTVSANGLSVVYSDADRTLTLVCKPVPNKSVTVRYVRSAGDGYEDIVPAQLYTGGLFETGFVVPRTDITGYELDQADTIGAGTHLVDGRVPFTYGPVPQTVVLVYRHVMGTPVTVQYRDAAGNRLTDYSGAGGTIADGVISAGRIEQSAPVRHPSFKGWRFVSGPSNVVFDSQAGHSVTLVYARVPAAPSPSKPMKPAPNPAPNSAPNPNPGSSLVDGSGHVPGSASAPAAGANVGSGSVSAARGVAAAGPPSANASAAPVSGIAPGASDATRQVPKSQVPKSQAHQRQHGECVVWLGSSDGGVLSDYGPNGRVAPGRVRGVADVCSNQKSAAVGDAGGVRYVTWLPYFLSGVVIGGFALEAVWLMRRRQEDDGAGSDDYGLANGNDGRSHGAGVFGGRHAGRATGLGRDVGLAGAVSVARHSAVTDVC